MDLKVVKSGDSTSPRRNNERPQQILNAAIELFRDNGFEGTRLEDVADKAGVSKATIYLYFDSKEDLFFALIREHVVPMVDQTINELERFEGTAAAFLTYKAHGMGRMLAHTNHGAILKLVVAEARRFPEIADYFREQVPKRGMDNLSQLIQRGIDNGEFRPCDTRAAAAAFIFPLLMNGIWANSIGPSEIVDPDAVIDLHCENFIRGILA